MPFSPTIPSSFAASTATPGWANTRALEIAKITRDTPDPPGGQILKDAKGEPTAS